MTETPWFHDRHVGEPEEDETGKRFYQFRIGAWLTILLLLLAGCATTSEEMRVCYVQLIGKTDSGVFVEAQHCMSPEAFETQK